MTASLKKPEINKNKWLMGDQNLQNICLSYALYPKLHKDPRALLEIEYQKLLSLSLLLS
jgi:hypothetical protein